MTVTVNDIKKAYTKIAPYIIKTPLLRMPNLDKALGCQVYIKAECMQTTGAFKLRGALNKILSLSPAEIAAGIVAVSSGNHGRAVAYCSQMVHAVATVVVPRTAPQIKINNIKALGAEIVLADAVARFKVAEEICAQKKATLVLPYNDETIIAGQGTIGLEIAEQQPDLNMVVVPVSGGGLIGGTSTAIKGIAPQMQVYGAEPEPLPRYSTSLAAGHPVTVEQKSTAADALVSNTPGSLCFPLVQKNVTSVVPVSDSYTLKATKLLLTEGKIYAEPSACIGIGAVLQGLIPVTPTTKVCFVISGGNVALEQLDVLKEI